MKMNDAAINGLRSRRKAIGLTQAETASQIGVSRQSYAAWEAGKSQPSAALLPALSKALGCTIEELYEQPREINA